MSVSDYEQLLRSCIKQNEHVIDKLCELNQEMEEHHTVCNSVKTVGTTAGVVGTGMMIGSLLAAPFTGGTSLFITLGSAACSIGGATTNIVTDAVDRSKTKRIIGEIQSLINSRAAMASTLEEQSNRVRGVIQHLVSNNVNEHTAFYTTFNALANGQLKTTGKSVGTGDYQPLVVMGRLVQTELDLLKSIGATSKAVSAVSKAAPGVNQMIMKSAPLLADEAAKLGLIGSSAVSSGSQVLKTGGQAASGLAKTLATAAVVTSVVVTVVDVAFLIRDWESNHPTVDMIQNILKQLKDETKSFKNLLSTLDQLRERVYLAAIENIPVIGSIACINDALIALLNQDINQCIEIFKELDIEWPFVRTLTIDQLVRFFSEHQVFKGFDAVQLNEILKQRGKKARKSVVCLVTAIVAKVQEEAKASAQARKNKSRSNRGEHVINNGVLSLQKDIIDMFLQQRLNKSFGQLTRIPAESAIYQAYHYPFDATIRNNIQNVMVARISDDVLYFDANALLYGVLVYILRLSAKGHMTYFYDNPGVQGSPSTTTLRTTRFFMNQMLAYVDQFALQYWLKVHGGNPATYETSKISVYRMFLNLDDQIRLWVQELKRFGY